MEEEQHSEAEGSRTGTVGLTSMEQRFAGIRLSSNASVMRTPTKQRLQKELTPIQEEPSGMIEQSALQLSHPAFHMPSVVDEVEEEKVPLEEPPTFIPDADVGKAESEMGVEMKLIGKLRQAYAEVVGGDMQLLNQRRLTERLGKVNYSLSLLAAISQERFEAAQLVEGMVDASVFENFLFQLLRSIRQDPERRGRPLVVLMDNARIHGAPLVMETLGNMKVLVLLNAQYSPSLNPVEQFFGQLKQAIKRREPHGR